MGVIDRKTYKRIEFYLYNYRELTVELEQHKTNIIESGNRELIDFGQGVSYRSDPTANRAVKLCNENVLETERWSKVIDKVKSRFKGTLKGELIRFKYERGMSEIATCRELNIERSTYYAWRQEIVLYAALVAAQVGLIQVA